MLFDLVDDAASVARREIGRKTILLPARISAVKFLRRTLPVAYDERIAAAVQARQDVRPPEVFKSTFLNIKINIIL